MKRVLWLTSWYPNRTAPLNGDFIERHAVAASMRNDITALFVVKDDFTSSEVRPFFEERNYSPNCRAVLRYYKGILHPGKFESIISGIRYFFIFKKLIKTYVRKYGKPDLINVHISFKAGLLGLYCKYRYGLPYIVSEQWSVFSPDAGDRFDKKNRLLKWAVRRIYKTADGVTAVSNQLSQALADRFGIALPVVIPNVVDPTKFFPGNHAHSNFRFIHISTLNEQKNFEQIIEAVAILKDKTTIPFELIVIGPRKNDLQKLVQSKGLDTLIEFMSEVDHDEIALQTRHSAAMVLYSRFETFGCVVGEALVSGVPVIVSDIGVMHELVEDMVNGVLIPLDNPDLLAEKMRWMIMNRYRFDSETISAAAGRKYNPNLIAELFDQYYDRVLSLR